MMRRPGADNLILGSLGVGALLLAWQVTALLTASELILPTPAETLAGLARIVVSDEFRLQAITTVARGFLALALIVLAALPMGLLSGHYRRFATFLTVPVAVVRSTPVISIILLALI